MLIGAPGPHTVSLEPVHLRVLEEKAPWHGSLADVQVATKVLYVEKESHCKSFLVAKVLWWPWLK